MESTLTNGQLILVIIEVISTVALFITIFWIWYKWFPATEKTRIREKKKGVILFYRPEVWRPIFGWTPIWASKYRGDICYNELYTSYKKDCIETIDTFKKLKNITEETQE